MGNELRQLMISSLISAPILVLVTLTRLIIRRHRLWADDACAFLSMLALFGQVTGAIIHSQDPDTISHKLEIIAYYVMFLFFYPLIWLARLSILFSIIRIHPIGMRRSYLYLIAGIFALTGTLLVGQGFWVCEPQSEWKAQRTPQCSLDNQVVICQIVSDVISDSILLALPIRLFRYVSDKALRSRFILIFSTAICTTVVSLVHGVLILTNAGGKILIAGIVEGCVSLAVCNVPVIATAFFPLRNRGPPNHQQSSIVFASSSGSGGQQTTFLTGGRLSASEMDIPTDVSVENKRTSTTHHLGHAVTMMGESDGYGSSEVDHKYPSV